MSGDEDIIFSNYEEVPLEEEAPLCIYEYVDDIAGFCISNYEYKLSKEQGYFEEIKLIPAIKINYFTSPEYINSTEELMEYLEYAKHNNIDCMLLDAIKLISTLYGEDNYGIEFLHRKKIVEITYKLPDFIISNTDKVNHTISDLYIVIAVKPSFNDNTIKIAKPLDGGFTVYGFRGSATVDEISGCYAHSHLTAVTYSTRENRVLAPTRFCLGEGPLQTMSAYYVNYNISLLQFELFVKSIDSMVKWESLEGTPHKKIADLPQRSANSISYNLPELDSIWYSIRGNSTYFSSIYSVVQELDSNDYVFAEDGIKIVLSTKIHRILFSTFYSYRSVQKDLGISQDGFYYKALDDAVLTSIDAINSLASSFRFKRELHPFVVKTEGEIKKLDLIKTIHPYILNKILQSIEDVINNNFNEFRHKYQIKQFNVSEG